MHKHRFFHYCPSSRALTRGHITLKNSAMWLQLAAMHVVPWALVIFIFFTLCVGWGRQTLLSGFIECSSFFCKSQFPFAAIAWDKLHVWSLWFLIDHSPTLAGIVCTGLPLLCYTAMFISQEVVSWNKGLFQLIWSI